MTNPSPQKIRKFLPYMSPTILDPDVLLSGFGVMFLFGLANFRKIPANFSANLDANFDSEFFGLVFSRASGSPKKITPKIHAQTCRHSSPISLSRTQTYFTPSFCLRGRPTIHKWGNVFHAGLRNGLRQLSALNNGNRIGDGPFKQPIHRPLKCAFLEGPFSTMAECPKTAHER